MWFRQKYYVKTELIHIDMDDMYIKFKNIARDKKYFYDYLDEAISLIPKHIIIIERLLNGIVNNKIYTINEIANMFCLSLIEINYILDQSNNLLSLLLKSYKEIYNVDIDVSKNNLLCRIKQSFFHMVIQVINLKQEEFKNFVRTKPELIKFVQNGEMTWQKFYELYDLYGTDEKVWNKYILDERSPVEDSISKITSMVKNVDVDSIKSHINTAQKAIDFVTDLTKKNGVSNPAPNLAKGPVSPRPLNKFFEDQMEKFLQMSFRENPKMFELLKQNSYYFKGLNRGVVDYKKFVSDMKVKYKERTSDKLESIMDNMELVSSVLNVLK